jgi:hypothetical protein
MAHLHDFAACPMIFGYRRWREALGLDLGNNDPRSQLIINECGIHLPNLLNEVVVKVSYSDSAFLKIPPPFAPDVGVRIENADYYFRNVPIN